MATAESEEVHTQALGIVKAGANAFIKGAAVTPPADDPSHPWWKVPQDASYDTYYKLWEKWRCTKGRVFL